MLSGPVLTISGGVGGAKLALGLYRVLPPDELTIVANTADDFEHLGLSISPDLDTLMYTLAGISNAETGWGRAGETWTFMQALEQLGGETWFCLGDADLATHIERTQGLKAGRSLTEITDQLCRRLGVEARLLPMTDDPVRTMVKTSDRSLPFQQYFVKLRCEPAVVGFEFEGIEAAQPNPEFLKLIQDRRLRALIICPSNPFISIDPVLSLPGVRAALGSCAAPVVAVSPLIGDRAVKGPTAKMMNEMGIPSSSVEVAGYYGSLLGGFVADVQDEDSMSELPLPVHTTQTLMRSLADRERLAREVLSFADRLKGSRQVV